MPGIAKAYDATKIHQGPGDLWLIDPAPNDAAERLTLATDGTPDSTAHANSVHMGAIVSAVTSILKPKHELIQVDSFEGPVSVFVTELEMIIEAELAQLEMDKIAKGLGVGTYSTAAGYKQIVFGGDSAPAQVCVAAITKKRSDPTKFVVSMLYKAVGMGGAEFGFTRSKAGFWKASFRGLTDTARTSGKQIGIWYETI